MTKPTMWLYAQQRLRSAWASAQSDQSSLCAQWVAKGPSFLHADSDNSDQTGRMPRLVRVFAGRTLTLLVLSRGGSYNSFVTFLIKHCFKYCKGYSGGYDIFLIFLLQGRKKYFTNQPTLLFLIGLDKGKQKIFLRLTLASLYAEELPSGKNFQPLKRPLQSKYT